jgi:hypothetical protein
LGKSGEIGESGGKKKLIGLGETDVDVSGERSGKRRDLGR